MSHTRNSHLVDFNAGILTKESTPVAYSDGATTNRAIVYGPFDSTYNPRGWLAGAEVLEICGWVDILTTNPPANTEIFSVGSTSTGAASLANSIAIRLNSDGNFGIFANAVDTNNRRFFTFSTFRVTYSGQRIFLRVILTQGTTNPVVWVNGVNISSQFTLSTAGTPPNWLDSNLNSTYHLVGFNWPSGNLPVIVPILGTLTEVEAASVRTTGVFPDRVFQGGYAQRLSYPQDSFEDSVTTWGHTGPGFAAKSNSSDFARTGTRSMKVETSVSGGLVWMFTVVAGFPANLQSCDFEAWIYIPSGQPGAAGIISSWAGANAGTGNGTGYNSLGTLTSSPTVFDQWFRLRRVGIIRGVNGASAAPFIGFNAAPANGVFYIDDGKFTISGALQLPSANLTQVISDATAIGNNSGILIGGSTQCSCREGEFTNVISWNGTHEAKRIFGSAGRVHNGNIRILSIVTKATVASSGSGLTIGTTTSNNRYVTANTFTTAKKVHTLANVLPASTAVNDCDFLIDPDTANYTGAITVTVRYEMLSFNV
jgi:hypothetical protein